MKEEEPELQNTHLWYGQARKRTDIEIGMIYGGFPVTSMNSKNSIRSLNGNVFENKSFQALLEVKSSIYKVDRL